MILMVNNDITWDCAEFMESLIIKNCRCHFLTQIKSFSNDAT